MSQQLCRWFHYRVCSYLGEIVFSIRWCKRWRLKWEASLNSFPTSGDFCYCCKQFGHRSGLTCQAWSSSKLFDTLMFFLRLIILKKNQQATKKHEKSNSMQTVKAKKKMSCFWLHLQYFNPVAAIFKCTQYAGGKYGYFDVTMVLHIISYKIITTVGICTKFFPACLRHLV